MLTGYTDFRTHGWDRAFADFATLSRQLDRLAGAAVVPRPSVVSPTPASRAVRVELAETPQAFILRAEVPGLTEGQIELQLEDGILTLRARRELAPPEGFSATRRERSPFVLDRRFEVPREVDAEHIEAVLKHGVLRVNLPKAAVAKPRQIPVQSR
jgi:HSP20 family protein